MSGVPVPRIFPFFSMIPALMFPLPIFLLIFSYIQLFVMVIRYGYTLWLYVMGQPAQIRYSSFPCAEHSDEPLKPEIVCAIELHDF